MPFDYAVPSVPDGSRIDYSDGLLVHRLRRKVQAAW
jgi:hypothetical protein